MSQHASICFRGHVQSITSRSGMHHETTDSCPTCGAVVLVSCTSCDAFIPEHPTITSIDHAARGTTVTLDVDHLIDSYERPAFCVKCGAAFPWLGRQERVWELENRLGQLVDDENERLVLAEQLQVLVSSELDEDETVSRWQKVAAIAGGGFKTAMTDVGLPLVNAAVKSKLGLDD